VLKSKQRHLA